MLKVAGHCFTLSETTQAFTKNANLRVDIIYFLSNVSISKGLGCLSCDDTMTSNPSLHLHSLFIFLIFKMIICTI